ncbi:hypothetical protein ABQE15_05395 [Enterococcus gallinarum]|uniref:hypothetical protein n=1 Tax=Enterococcus gallinarum TaxID=1353 RepID=UPI0032E4348F
MSDKLAVLMEFNGYTKDELEAYLSLKFGSMTKGGMTASILSQSGYEKAKSVIFGQPQLNPNQQIVLEWLKLNYDYDGDHEAMWNIFMMYYYHTRDSFTDRLSQAIENLTNDEQIEILREYSQWALEQGEE